MEPIIKTEKLKVIYNFGRSNEVRALDGVDVEIFPQEYIIIFGPSGCGKSTLLYSMSGLEVPTSGKVFAKKKDISSLTQEETVAFHQSSVGMIFQAYYLIPSLTVMENIVLPQIFQDISFDERVKRAEELLKRFGIFEQAKKLPSHLSGGQQQRVAISRALINNSDIILADEPIGNLDSDSAKIVMDLLKEINEKDKKTIILVTHNPQFLYYANRVYYMKDGKVVREIVNKERVKKKKKKITKGFSAELEKLAKVFPYFSRKKLQSKAFANYLTNGLDIDRMQRLENVIGDFISKKIDEKIFLKKLNSPFEKNGVGLYSPTAKKYKKRINVIIKKSEEAKKYLEEEEKEATQTIRDLKKPITYLRMHLLNFYEGDLFPEQVYRLDTAIEGRLLGGFSKKQFHDFLDKSINKGGVGLNSSVARKFVRELEIIISQMQEIEILNKEEDNKNL